MRKLILLLLLLGACTGVSYEEHTDAGSKYVLSNGMTVIMKENPDTGMVAADLMIKRSIAANGKKYGLGHFTTRILLAGTETRTREDITREVEAVGGSISARTYAEYSEIIVEVPSDRFSVALEVLQDVLLNPTFSPEEIERERTLILAELESQEDQPEVVTEELFMKTMYKDHPYRHPKDGYVESVKEITREDLIEHYNTWYVPNKIILAMAGNLKKRETLIATKYLFGRMIARPTPDERVPELKQKLYPETNKRNMPLESFYIQYGHQLIPAVHPDFIKLRMANAILGSGSGSRLFYELRDQRALAYSVRSIAPSIRSTGFLKITMISRPQVINESLAGIKEQIEILKTEDVTEEEMQLVKQKIRGFFFLDHQRTTDQANYLGFYEMQGYGYHYDVEYPDRLDEVTAQEVKYVANKYFNNPATAIVGPFEDVIR